MTKFLPLAAVLTTACYEKAPPAGAGLNNTAPSIGVNTIDNDGDQFSEADGDCDDTDATVFPGAFELCDKIDNDCDGEVDNDIDASIGVLVYTDGDGDGFGDIDASLYLCDYALSDPRRPVWPPIAWTVMTRTASSTLRRPRCVTASTTTATPPLTTTPSTAIPCTPTPMTTASAMASLKGPSARMKDRPMATRTYRRTATTRTRTPSLAPSRSATARTTTATVLRMTMLWTRPSSTQTPMTMATAIRRSHCGSHLRGCGAVGHER